MTAGSGQEPQEAVSHLFLSPHYDDIALSCGGLSAMLGISGAAPRVALIFGDYPDPSAALTPFAQSLHDRWGFAAREVIDARRREDAQAASILGTAVSMLPFADAIYREARYASDEDLFGTVHADERHMPEAIMRAIDRELQPQPGTRFYAPLAIGNHVDHQLAFATGQLLHAAGHDVWFYEDLPYALIDHALERRMAMLDGLALSPQVVAIDDTAWQTKIEAILAYPSQLQVIFADYVGVEPTRAGIDGAMSRYARKVGEGTLAERYWTLPA